MRDVWFVAFCAIALLKIIEAKPGYQGHMDRGAYGNADYIMGGPDVSGHSLYGRGGNGKVDNGNGSNGKGDNGKGDNGNDGNGYGKGNGGIGYGNGMYGYDQRSGRRRWHSLEEIDWSFLKPSCSGSGCISVGNGYRNINIVDIVSK